MHKKIQEPDDKKRQLAKTIEMLELLCNNDPSDTKSARILEEARKHLRELENES